MNQITHKFITNIPENIEDGILYISLKYKTAIHKCCCGCGNEVVTPLSPVDWDLELHGNFVSLYPSIGNWNFKCQSHYWIENNSIIWVEKLSKNKIEEARKKDKIIKEKYFENKNKKNNLLSVIKNFFYNK